MSIADWKPGTDSLLHGETPFPVDPTRRRLHQIGEVRKRQGVSVRSVARRMKMDMSEVKVLEEPTSDMSLTTLYKWQQALEVPVASLLVDDNDPLSEPILNRARMVRLMKTAMAIQEKTDSLPVQRMTVMLIEQLLEIMPELKEVSPWHAVGQRRSLDECGRIAEHPLPDDWFS